MIATGKGPTRPLLVVYVGALGVAAIAVVAVGMALDREPPGSAAWWALPLVVGLLVCAEYLLVRFRYRGDVNALNLFEAVLAPLLFAFPPLAVVASVAGAQVVAGVIRRNQPVKATFNVVQWSLAAGIGSIVVASIASGTGLTLRSIAAIVAGLAAVGLVNQLAFTGAIAIATRRRARAMLSSFSPVILPGWIGGWVFNVLLGLLYVFAYDGGPYAVLLFAVPLVTLHVAYRAYAGARSDRARLAGMHRAVQVLSTPVDPNSAIEAYLRAVADCFESQSAVLVLSRDGERVLHRLVRDDDAYDISVEDERTVTLAGVLAAQPGPLRVTAGDGGPLAGLLASTGAKDCLAAPMFENDRLVGAVLVLDQRGLEGFAAGQLAVLSSLARETANAFAKGRLLETVIEERRKLDEIVNTTSDGIVTITADGRVTRWNPAMATITGVTAEAAIESPQVLRLLRPRTAAGVPIELVRWRTTATLPPYVRITTPDGADRRLSCSYSRTGGDESTSTLVVIARDVTPAQEAAALREEFHRLVEIEAAQRLVVEELQNAVTPAPLHVPTTDLAVTYVASDDTSPTGGDLWDWQVLPSGELHICVIDVLGHGVTATKDAITVVHALRNAAFDGTPLEQLVRRVDRLLTTQNPDLVATVIVARYDPRTGRVRVAAGGHPPALLLTARGEVTQIAATGGAIGWPGAGSDLIGEAVLGVNDALILYTDGLVEANRDIIAGIEALMDRAVEVAHLPAELLASSLIDGVLAAAERRDDTLALVLRRTPVAKEDSRFTRRIAPDAQAASVARHDAIAWLDSHGLPNENVALAIAELLSNAVRTARSSIVLKLERGPGTVVIEVADDGHGDQALAEAGREPADEDAEAGRGLHLVRSISEHFDALSTSEGSVVRCVVRTGPRPTHSEIRVPAARKPSPTTGGHPPPA